MAKMEYLDEFITERIELAMKELRSEYDFSTKHKKHLMLTEKTFMEIENERAKAMVNELIESYNLVYAAQLDKAYQAGAADLVKLLKHFGVL